MGENRLFRRARKDFPIDRQTGQQEDYQRNGASANLQPQRNKTCHMLTEARRRSIRDLELPPRTEVHTNKNLLFA